MIQIALPTGRLGAKSCDLLTKIGFSFEDMDNDRRLAFESADKRLRCFRVKPSDVAVYVERGAADVGIAGKDTLLESGCDVYELCDLGIGRCKMCVAAPAEYTEPSSLLRVATKYPRIASRYYEARGLDTELIKLHGSIELAAVLGISDVIVDIVETGKTLRENGLEIKEEICGVSARLISNRASYRFKEKDIRTLMTGLTEAIKA